MKKILVAAAVLSAILLPGSVLADTGLKDLFKREHTSLSKVPGRQLKSLLSTPKPKSGGNTGPVNFNFSWLDAQPEPTGGENWKCLSEALYFEARGETVKGQFAVAEVIMNRVQSARFPDNLCGVIRQGTGRKYQCQFTYTCDGHAEVINEPKAFERVSKVARAIMDGLSGNLTNGATYYHTAAVRPKWAKVFTETARIGDHIFYRNSVRTASSE